MNIINSPLTESDFSVSARTTRRRNPGPGLALSLYRVMCSAFGLRVCVVIPLPFFPPTGDLIFSDFILPVQSSASFSIKVPSHLPPLLLLSSRFAIIVADGEILNSRLVSHARAPCEPVSRFIWGFVVFCFITDGEDKMLDSSSDGVPAAASGLMSSPHQHVIRTGWVS